MVINRISPDMSAFELAQLLSKELQLDIPISCEVEEGKYFQFDPDNRIVCCSNDAVEDIAASERAEERAYASFCSVLNLASPSFDAASCGTDESIKYATFSCLHEFGHYLQSIEWDTDELEARAEERDKLIREANAEAQKRADKGAQYSEVYTLFEDLYRSIPIEHDADMRANKLLSEILCIGD